MMPVDWNKYPANWHEIANNLKKSVNWICESCGKQCRKQDEVFDTHRRTLTVAHINHVESDCMPENLIALCSSCHLKYDAPRKRLQKIVKKRISKKWKGGK